MDQIVRNQSVHDATAQGRSGRESSTLMATLGGAALLAVGLLGWSPLTALSTVPMGASSADVARSGQTESAQADARSRRASGHAEVPWTVYLPTIDAMKVANAQLWPTRPGPVRTPQNTD